jgi:hypothetical protein
VKDVGNAFNDAGDAIEGAANDVKDWGEQAAKDT